MQAKGEIVRKGRVALDGRKGKGKAKVTRGEAGAKRRRGKKGIRGKRKKANQLTKKIGHLMDLKKGRG